MFIYSGCQISASLTEITSITSSTNKLIDKLGEMFTLIKLQKKISLERQYYHFSHSSYKHYHNEALFISTIFVSMPRPTSVYILSM